MAQPASMPAPRRLPDDFALAVACCRWTFSGEGAEDVRRLAEAVDWGELLATCRRHRVTAALTLRRRIRGLSPNWPTRGPLRQGSFGVRPILRPSPCPTIPVSHLHR